MIEYSNIQITFEMLFEYFDNLILILGWKILLR
jgi:hypothetical protein